MIYSTQEAIRKGLTATPEEKLSLSRLRRLFKIKFRQALRRNQYDLACVFATQAQFCREAIDAHIVLKQNRHILNL